MKNPFRATRVFFHETVGELKKAAWPSKKELIDSTIVVIVAVLILGAFISLSDFCLYEVVHLFTRIVRPETG